MRIIKIRMPLTNLIAWIYDDVIMQHLSYIVRETKLTTEVFCQYVQPGTDFISFYCIVLTSKESPKFRIIPVFKNIREVSLHINNSSEYTLHSFRDLKELNEYLKNPYVAKYLIIQQLDPQ